MRPVKLKMEGFASYMEPQTLDLEGVGLFALCGPTGAGKSSILDAIVFALYGMVPRYDDQRVVAPVITQGKSEARVQLDFTMAGKPYTVARVVQRQGEGATTKEARLESQTESLASGADQVTKAIEGLLGLTFEQFTKCVMLPQGDFARFLHDQSRDRNKLLQRLLGFDLYGNLQRLASEECGRLTAEQNRVSGRLDGLAHATPAGLKLLKGRIKDLEELQKSFDKIWPELSALQSKIAEVSGLSDKCARNGRLLRGLRIPEGTGQLSEELKAAQETVAAAAEELKSCHERSIKAADAMQGLMKLDEIRLGIQSHTRMAEVCAHESATIAKLAEAEKALKAAVFSCGVSKDAYEEAVAELSSLQNRHAAFHLASSLHAGDPCPVCGSAFSKFPGGEPEAVLTASAAVESAKAALAEAEGVRDRARSLREGASATVNEHGRQKAEMEKRLEGVRPLGELEGLLQKVETADYEQKEAQRILGLAVGRQGAANDVLKLLEDRTGKAASIFEDAVRSVVELGPPNIDRRNLTEAWKALLAWATERAAEMDAEKARLDLEGLEAAEAKNALMLIAANSAMEAGLAAESGHEREACLSAIAGLRADATRCEQDLEAAKGLTAELKTLKDEFKLFNGVRLHLSANRFETWYLNRTFHRLCAVASERLKQLSSGQYSISVTNKNEFQVVDHLNAGEKRSVKTLSGGETFLASLSLALALAEEVSQSSAGTKLESLFLDEGFGTLDPDTLDIVSSAIEELGSRGQMIGVITHVREFAERVPVRFEVRKEAKGSRLEKVMA